MKMKHWQDATNAVVGAWLLVSPWVLGFSGSTAATAIALSLGIALLAAAMSALAAPQAWEEWLEFGLGVCLVVSPWLLGYSGDQAATGNAFIAGAVVICLALWVLASDRDFGLLREPPAV